MKIITVNLKRPLIATKIIFKLVCFLIILTFCVKLSECFYSKNYPYQAAALTLAQEKTIIIDAGHGGEDCGAIGTNKVLEKNLNLEIATALGEEFTKAGWAVIYTRLDDKLLYTEEENIYGIRKISDLKNRCKIGAENPNTLFVSIHMNSFSEAKYSGTHVYYSLNNEMSYGLAMSVQGKIREELQPGNNRVPKPGEGMYLMENLENPALLIECGFLTNPDECEKLSEKEYQKQLSFLICCGIIEYIDKN